MKFTPPSCIDILYDYLPLLVDKPLCQMKEKALGSEVAIVGAGAAGMLAAYELLKMGLKPTIYEASNRIGGRLYSKQFESVSDEIKPFAEMGAMRIPKSSRIFLHYAKKIGLTPGMPFPGPGIVDTSIYYKNALYTWSANQEPPAPFAQIKFLWELFISPLVEEIHLKWKKNDTEGVRKLWQFYINQYKDKSFYEVLKERSPINTPEQLNIFGSMGVGGGGFAPFFSADFLEILRFLVNCYFDNLVFLPNGLSEFPEKLYHFHAKSAFCNGSLADKNCLELNKAVIFLDYNLKTNNPIVATKDQNGVIEKKEYSAVIFTGSVAAAQLINLTGSTQSGPYLFDTSTREAIKNSSMLASSKTFICTKNKFWIEEKMPTCILTDELPRAVYFLDYPQTTHGVVCMSYTWGIDSIKLHAVDPKDRIVIFRRAMEPFFGTMTKYLEPLNDEVMSIDWLNQKYQNGTCSVFIPGNESGQKSLYFQFQSCLSKEDKGVYLAGDTISWSAGWVEGALYTGLNAVYAVAHRLGAIIPNGSPLTQNPNFYEH